MSGAAGAGRRLSGGVGADGWGLWATGVGGVLGRRCRGRPEWIAGLRAAAAGDRRGGSRSARGPKAAGMSLSRALAAAAEPAAGLAFSDASCEITWQDS